MKLRSLFIKRCLAAAALLLGLFGTLMIQFFFHLQFSGKQEALAAQSTSLAQSLEAAAVNYALQGIPLSDEILRDMLSALDSSAALYTTSGSPLADSPDLPFREEGIYHRDKSLFALCRVYLDAQEYLLYLPSELDVLYQNRTFLLMGYAALYLILMSAFAAVISFTARQIARPIEQLSFVSQRLAHGEAKLRAEPCGTEEICTLSESFNLMADSLTGEIERQNRFIADLTHEFKTPLTAMIGHADLIRSGQLKSEDVQLSAHQIVKEGQRLNALCARMIDLILLKNDSLSVSELFAPSLVEDTAAAFAPDAASKGIELTTQCDDALIAADPILLRLILNNLTDNALKSDAHHVYITGTLHKNTFTLSVRDDGCGMDAAALEKITEPFYRVDKSRSRLQGGAGLGLALCAQIAALHDTRLMFESSPGNGTTVSIMLPAKEVPYIEEA